MPVRKTDNSWWVDIRYGRRRYRKKSPDNSKIEKQKAETFCEFSEQWYNTYVLYNNKFLGKGHEKLVLRNYCIFPNKK